ncbi:hypothetical protein [Asanoa sp. NPDC050611]|uniref:hypothetical protein n=1 Tax=Asanoa sp. NPDC050611 TaxID=3157098 RepID=UPI0033CF438F
MRRSPVSPDDFDGVLFGLDGVLTTAASLHEAAWRTTFDTFLDEWDATHGTSTPRFEVADYAAYVEGKPRQDAVVAGGRINARTTVDAVP